MFNGKWPFNLAYTDKIKLGMNNKLILNKKSTHFLSHDELKKYNQW